MSCALASLLEDRQCVLAVLPQIEHQWTSTVRLMDRILEMYGANKMEINEQKLDLSSPTTGSTAA